MQSAVGGPFLNIINNGSLTSFMASPNKEINNNNDSGFALFRNEYSRVIRNNRLPKYGTQNIDKTISAVIKRHRMYQTGKASIMTTPLMESNGVQMQPSLALSYGNHSNQSKYFEEAARHRCRNAGACIPQKCINSTSIDEAPIFPRGTSLVRSCYINNNINHLAKLRGSKSSQNKYEVPTVTTWKNYG